MFTEHRPLRKPLLGASLALLLTLVLGAAAQVAPPPAPLEAAPTPAVTQAPDALPPAPPAEAPAAEAPAPAATPLITNAVPAAIPAGLAETSAIPGVAVDQNGENPNLISIALDNVPLEDVVRLFTRISGANIIATTSNLQGTVTVNLKDVEWKPALSSILDMHELTLLEKTPGTQIYSIISKPVGAPEPMTTETVFLRYAGVSNAVVVVRNLLPVGATVSPYLPANALIIRSTASSLSDIQKIVAKIDTPRQQVFIEAKFLELNDSAIEDLGINWQILGGLDGKPGGLNISATGLKDAYTETTAKNELNSQGVLGIQTKTTARGRSLANNVPVAGSDLGADATKSQIVDAKLAGKNVTDFSYDPDSEVVTWQQVPSYEMKRIRTAILSVEDLSVMLAALKQTEGASVVSNPKIIVANEEPATIHIGSTERPFISTVTPGTQNSEPIVTYNPGDPVDLGVKVKVTPTINTEHSITVRIEPELTRRLSDSTAPNGQTYPVISTKKIQTIFSLDSGKTAAIGGLTETSDDVMTKKIPLLGDIPLIGKYLFSYTHKNKSQTETIIFVTVSIANPESIEKKTGVPEDSALVHKYLLKQTQEKQAQDKEIAMLEAAQKQAETNPPKKSRWSRWFGQ